MAERSRDAAATRPELVIGLIGPTGCGLPTVVDVLVDQLARFGYHAKHLKVSETFRSIGGPISEELPQDGPRDIRYEKFQDAGDRLRTIAKRKDAALLPTLRGLRQLRSEVSGRADEPATGTAYIIDSLKTPEELRLLGRIYGPRLVSISAYAPRSVRRDFLAQAIAESHFENRTQGHHDSAERILFRDERGAEDDEYGQNVANTFPLADVLIHSSAKTSVQASLERFFDILFSQPFITPTIDEYGMFLAQASSLRSAAMSRQVGAAILTDRGQVVSLGTNEVPRAGGGAYWPGDSPDGREFADGVDSSFAKRRNILGNTLKLLLAAGWRPKGNTAAKLSANEQEALVDVQLELISESRLDPRIRQLRRGLLVEDIIEYFREAHAEMSALLDAALRGVSTSDCTLYCTTFPCHECARHIVAAGIKRVVFLEPYPKSLVADFYRDSISIDMEGDVSHTVCFETFVGVAPRRYPQVFRALERRAPRGKTAIWREGQAELREDVFLLPIVGDDEMAEAIRTSDRVASLQREDIALAGLTRAYTTSAEVRKWRERKRRRPPTRKAATGKRKR